MDEFYRQRLCEIWFWLFIRLEIKSLEHVYVNNFCQIYRKWFSQKIFTGVCEIFGSLIIQKNVKFMDHDLQRLISFVEHDWLNLSYFHWFLWNIIFIEIYQICGIGFHILRNMISTHELVTLPFRTRFRYKCLKIMDSKSNLC